MKITDLEQKIVEAIPNRFTVDKEKKTVNGLSVSQIKKKINDAHYDNDQEKFDFYMVIYEKWLEHFGEGRGAKVSVTSVNENAAVISAQKALKDAQDKIKENDQTIRDLTKANSDIRRQLPTLQQAVTQARANPPAAPAAAPSATPSPTAPKAPMNTVQGQVT